MKTAKQELLEVLEQLPDDTPMDTLLARMHFKASILRGLEQSERGEGVPQEEVERRVNKWRESSGRQRLSKP
jgi:hypothetical protein